MPEGEQPSVGDLAAFYRYAIERRMIDYSDAVRWADDVIAASDRPDIRIIELSLARAENVDECLRELGSDESDMAIRLYFSLLYAEFRAGLRTAAWVANELYGLSREFAQATRVLGDEIDAIDEWFEPWAAGPQKAALDVEAFLEATPRVDLHEWLYPDGCQS